MSTKDLLQRLLECLTKDERFEILQKLSTEFGTIPDQISTELYSTMDSKKALGLYIQKVREDQAISEYKVVKEASIHYNQLHAIERGEGYNSDVLFRYLEYLQLKIQIK